MNDQEKQDIAFLLETIEKDEDFNLALKVMRGHELIRVRAELIKTIQAKEEKVKVKEKQ